MHGARKVTHKQLGIWTLQALAINTLLFIRLFLIHFCHICILHSTQLARVVPGRSLLILLPPGFVLSRLDGDALFSKVRLALGDVCTR